jgi:phosphatidylethanolamine-binding protein (PEBP) family uncharacterized protein
MRKAHKLIILLILLQKYIFLLTISPFCLNGENLLFKYSKYGENRLPSLEINNLTKKYFAIFFYDITTSNKFVHWFVYDVLKTELIQFLKELANNKLSSHRKELINDFGFKGYGGPQPPSGSHTYEFILYEYDESNSSIFENCPNITKTYEKVQCEAKNNNWYINDRKKVIFEKPKLF